MKAQKRIGVFETNSSSTHSICIPKEDTEMELPKQLHLGLGEFGWECDTLDSIAEKASYLYTGLTCNQRYEDIVSIIEILQGKGIGVTSEKESDTKYFYVDHSNEMQEFLDAVCSDEDKLLRFLFSPMAFIITGNDNDDEDVDIEVSYEHDEYYKGN
mgnify:CR=1 FL=1